MNARSSICGRRFLGTLVSVLVVEVATGATPAIEDKVVVPSAPDLVREVADLVQEHFLDPELRGLDWATIRDDTARQAQGVESPVDRAK